MAGTSRTFSLLILALLTLPVAGCVRMSKTSELDDLKSRVSSLERKTEVLEASLRMGERLSALEKHMVSLSQQRQPVYVVPQGGVAAQEGPARGADVATAESEEATASPFAAPTFGYEHPERYGGTYRQALGTDPPSLDPAHISDTTSHRVGMNIFEGLVEFSGRELEIAPVIARSWEISEDGTVFTFQLRDDVKFHNGRLVVADDFVYSYTRMLDPATASERAWLFADVLGYDQFEALLAARGQIKYVADGNLSELNITRAQRALEQMELVTLAELQRAGVPEAEELFASAELLTATLRQVVEASRAGGFEAIREVELPPGLMEGVGDLDVRDFISRGLTAPDAQTLRIELRRPFAPFLAILAMPNAAVVPREACEEWGDQFSSHPVGTGPFEFVDWQHHVGVELKAFDRYFMGRPYLDAMKFRVLPDEVARLYEFEIGNIESINDIPDEKYESIKANPNFPGIMQEMPTLSVYYMGFNVEKEPFTNPLVRKAFNYAVRKDIIVNVVRRGRGSAAEGVLPPGLPGFNAELEGYGYDKQKAIELLKEAGYENPADLGEIEYWYNATSPNDPNAKLAEVIQQNLGEIGVKTKLQSTDWATYLKKLDRGELAMFRLAWVADYPDADNFLYVLFHSSMKGEAGNHSYYGNPKVDELLDRARVSNDKEERIRSYQEAEKIIVEEAPWIFLYHAKQAFMHKPYVKGAELTGMGPDAVQMRGAWLDKTLMEQD